MRHIMRVSFVTATLILCSVLGEPQSGVSPLDIPVSQDQQSGTLADLILNAAARYRVPIVAELAQPIPDGILAPTGTISARDYFNVLMRSAPRYIWLDRGGVVVIADRRLQAAPLNFMNNRLARFRMPDTVADLKLTLPTMLAHPEHPSAGLITGVADKELTSMKLSAGQVLNDVVGRDILVEAGRENSMFVSVIVFPTACPHTKAEIESAFANWMWFSNKALSERGVHIRSIAPHR